jgi:hypothetical protein
MFIGELILRRDSIRDKIPELQKQLEQKGCVSKEEYDDTVSELFRLISELQSFNIILNRSNNKSKLKLGGKDITVTDALEINKTLKKKIGVFSGLINETPDTKFSILSLFKQRDGLLEEYFVVSKAIILSDWSNEVD